MSGGGFSRHSKKRYLKGRLQLIGPEWIAVSISLLGLAISIIALLK
jgi:hypothetical protein